MYLEQFGFNSDPFRLSPDSKFFYPSLSHTTAKQYMDYVLWSRDSFIVITGEIGTGKTTLIQKMLEDAGDKLTVAKIHQTQLDEIEFIQALLDQFGINPFHTSSKVELLSMLNKYLQKKYEEGETVVLIIDEAQNLSTRVLEEIRLLSGFDSNREKLLNVFLVGQPQLRDRLMQPEMEQLFQRIRLRFHLQGLGFDEVRSYIRHRLGIASIQRFEPRVRRTSLFDYSASNEEIDLPLAMFPDSLMPVILKYTGGIPRLINTLCDTALLVLYAKGGSKVDEAILLSAIEDLQWVPYSERSAYGSTASRNTEFSLYVTRDKTVMSIEHLSRESMLVGRSHVCDIKIDQKSISGKHFRLDRTAKGYTVVDLGSTNGTWVNGKKITVHELSDGDVISIGKYELAYTRKDTSSDPKLGLDTVLGSEGGTQGRTVGTLG